MGSDATLKVSPPCSSAGEGSRQFLVGSTSYDELQGCFPPLSMTASSGPPPLWSAGSIPVGRPIPSR